MEASLLEITPLGTSVEDAREGIKEKLGITLDPSDYRWGSYRLLPNEAIKEDLRDTPQADENGLKVPKWRDKKTKYFSLPLGRGAFLFEGTSSGTWYFNDEGKLLYIKVRISIDAL